MTIKKRLLLLILFSSLIPTLAVGISVYYFLQNAIIEQVESNFKDKLESVKVSLERQLSALEQNSDYIAESGVMQEIATRDESLNIAALIQTVKDNYPIVREVTVISPRTGFITSTDAGKQDNFLEFEIENEEDFALDANEQVNFVLNFFNIPFLVFKQVINEQKVVAKLGETNEMSYVIKPIKDFYSEGRTIGALVIEIEPKFIADVFKKANFGRKPIERVNYYFLKSNIELFSELDVSQLPAKDIVSNMTNQEGFGQADINGERFLLSKHDLELPKSLERERMEILLLQPASLAYMQLNQMSMMVLSVSVGFLVFFMLLGFGLSGAISRPIEGLKNLTQSIIASGDLSIRIDVNEKSKDEIGELSTSFNQLLEDIETSKAQLEDYNKNLEKMVYSRTEELNQIQGELSEMLDHMHQAVMTFDEDFKINKQYSKFLSQLFVWRTKFENLDVMELLTERFYGNKDQFRSKLEFCFSVVFGQDELQWELFESEFPKEIELDIDGTIRALKLTFEPILVNGTVDRVMLISEDVTEMKRLTKLANTKQKELEMISSILELDPKIFANFLSDAKTSLAEIRTQVFESNKLPEQEEIDALFRELHTLKGNARVFKFYNLEEHLHNAENLLSELRELNRETWSAFVGKFESCFLKLQSEFRGYQQLFDEIIEKISRSAASSTDSDLLISVKDRVSKVISKINDNPDEKEIAKASKELFKIYGEIEKRVSFDLSPLMKQYQQMCEDLAKQLSKDGARFVTELKLRYVSESCGRLLSEITPHILRNSLDHGLESPAERADLQKNKQGCISLSINEVDNLIEVVIEDDGRGIDVTKLVYKSLEKGIIAANQVDAQLANPSRALQLIFHPGLSTAEEVSEISGRGVGLDAVKSKIEKFGGRIEVSSQSGVGTKFTIRLPKQEQGRKNNVVKLMSVS